MKAATRRKATNPQFDKEEVRLAASSRWPEVLSNVTGIDVDHLDGQHHPCPKCGGTDRFRFFDDNTGGAICNQCFRDKNGDGFGVVQWANGVDFNEAVRLVAEYIGAQPTTRPRTVLKRAKLKRQHRKKVDDRPDETLKFNAWSDALAVLWCGLSKPPVTVEGLKRCRARMARHYHTGVIVVPSYGEDLDIAKPVRWTAFDSVGRDLPTFKKDKLTGKTVQAGTVKVKNIPDGRAGIAGPVDLIATAKILLKLEGFSDLLTFYSLPDLDLLLAAGAVAFTTSAGASESPEPWMLSMIGDKALVRLHDTDHAGESGRLKWTAKVASDVRLPYPITPDHGRDFRDWVNEGHTGAELLELIKAHLSEVGTAEEATEAEAPETGPATKASIADAAEGSEGDEDGNPDEAFQEVLNRVVEIVKGGASAFYADEQLLDDVAIISCQSPSTYAAIVEELKSAGFSMRIYQRAMKPRLEEAAASMPSEMGGGGETGGFFVAEGCLCRTKLEAYGPLTVPLGNFAAEIVDETSLDDGIEVKTVFGIQGSLSTGVPLHRIEVPAEKFSEPGRWMPAGWGADPICWPGQIRAIPAAIQAMSTNKVRQRVFTHTGWREIDGRYVFLHAGGAIGTDADVHVSLSGNLCHVNLPMPVDDGELQQSVLASLQILELVPGKPAIPFAILGTVYRAPFGLLDSSLYLVGRSGVFKTEIAALAQQHFGLAFDARHLPANWSSTANAIEGSLFLAKDILTVVDDFAPQLGNAIQMHQKAEVVFRAQGNAAGRDRLRHDGSLRPAKPPRGAAMATGEDVPSGHSIQARLNVQELAPGDVDLTELSRCQQDGASGAYAKAMAAFLSWMAPQYEQLQANKQEKVSQYRKKVLDSSVSEGLHARAPSVVADVYFGFSKFLDFATEKKIISESQRKELLDRCWKNLILATADQAAESVNTDPASQFIGLLVSALATQVVHVADHDGQAPDNAGAWGWRSHDVPAATGGWIREWRPQGRKIGWLIAEGVLLDAEASYAAAHSLANSTGSGFSIRPVTLNKRLNEHGMLVALEDGRSTLKVRSTCEGRRVSGLLIKTELLLPSIGSETEANTPERGDAYESPD